MTFDKLNSLVCRVFFTLAFALLAISLLEVIAHEMGYTILRRSFDPSRLLEYAVILLVFVVAVLLRQIRQNLSKT